MNAKPDAGQPGQHDAVDHAVELAAPEQQHQQHRRALGGLLDPRGDQHRGGVHAAAAAGAGDRDQARRVEDRRRQRRHRRAPEEGEQQQSAGAPARSGPASGTPDHHGQRQQRQRRPRSGSPPLRCRGSPTRAGAVRWRPSAAPGSRPAAPGAGGTSCRSGAPGEPSQPACRPLDFARRRDWVVIARACLPPGWGLATRQGTPAPTATRRTLRCRSWPSPMPPGPPRSTPAASPS